MQRRTFSREFKIETVRLIKERGVSVGQVARDLDVHETGSRPHSLNAERSRFERGERALAEIDGDAGQQIIDSLADIAPDFARYIIEFPFGDLYSGPGLDLRAREIATIAALTAMGNAAPQLKVHIQAGLNVGLSREEIV